MDLRGPWKTVSGDDPRYAQPGFDDSQWPTFELPRQQIVRLGVHWLRRIVTAPGELRDPVFALGSLSHCYDIFVNGTRVGGNGCRPGEDPPFFLPNSFSIPRGLIEAGKPFVVALRTEGRYGRWNQLNQVRDEGPYLVDQRRSCRRSSGKRAPADLARGIAMGALCRHAVGDRDSPARTLA
jgi:hypothetical protein